MNGELVMWWLIILSVAVMILAIIGGLTLGLGPDGGQRPAKPARDLITPPPMIGNDTIRDWLIHYSGRAHIWRDVVAEFYRRAAAVPAVASYFPQDTAALQRHFTAQLVIVTHVGVTQSMLDTLTSKHIHVRNANGDPITAEIYDAVVATLVAVLHDAGVPPRGLEALAQTITPFRAALVQEVRR